MKTNFAAIAVLLAAASAANADTVNMKFTGTGIGSNVRISYNGSTVDVFAGQLKHEFTGATGTSSYINGIRNTFCSDLAQYVTSTPKPYEIVGISAMPTLIQNAGDKAAALSRLFNYAGNTAIATSASADWATAFQLTVWEIVTDYVPGTANRGLAITTGGFTAKRTDNSPLTSSVTSLVSQFFAAATNESNSTVAPIVGVTSGTAQDQIVVVPAPGAMALAGFGGLLSLTRVRRGKKA
jgi:hypothetical protein